MGDMREVFDLHRQVDKERKLTGAVRNRQRLMGRKSLLVL